MKNYIILAVLALAGNVIAQTQKRVDCGIWTGRCTSLPYSCNECDDYSEGQVVCTPTAPDLFCSTICRCV